jgi:nicotinate-nucleotide pyrophosphorylase (carboxylating)
MVLNSMQRMSTTKTNSFVKLLEGTNTKILLIPVKLRLVSSGREVVKLGGGENHRFVLVRHDYA